MANPSVSQLVELATVPPRCGDTRVILIDGRAGAGKSTLANRLAVALGGIASAGAGTYMPDAPLAFSAPIQMVHGDDLYEGWDGLATLDQVLLGRVLEPLAAGGDAEFQMWDWVRNEGTHTIPVPQRPWLIIEGVGVGLPRARELAVMTVFVDAPWDVRLQRGVDRDHMAYEDVVERWSAWEAQESALHESNGTRAAADVIIDGTAPVPD
jgi:uridine kinase